MIGNIAYTLAAVAGVILLLAGFGGAALAGMPLVGAVPVIGANLAWAAANASILLGSGAFLLALAFMRSFPYALVMTVIFMVVMYVIGVVHI